MEEMKEKFIGIIEGIDDINVLEYLLTYVSLTLGVEDQSYGKSSRKICKRCKFV